MCFFSLVGFFLRSRTILAHTMVGADSAYYKILLEGKIDLIVVRSSDELNFPPLFWALLRLLHRLFPRKWFEIMFPMIDLLTGVLAFAFSWLILEDPFIALAIFSLYMVHPQLTYQMSIVSTRPLGHLMFFLTMMTFYITHITQGNQALIFLILSSFFHAGTLLSHRSSSQNLWIVLGSFIIFTPINALIVLLLGITFALLFSKGFYFKVLKGHVIIVWFYLKQVRSLIKNHIKNIIKTIPQVFLTLLGFLCLFFVVIETFFVIWMVATFFSVIWWFWGDSERHLLYISVPSMMTLGLLISSISFPLSFGCWIFLWILAIVISMKYKPTYLDEKLMEICKNIRDLNPKAVIFSFGYGSFVAYCGQRRTVITNTIGNTADLFYVKKEFYDLPLIERLQKYNVTHVVKKRNNEWTLQSIDEHMKR